MLGDLKDVSADNLWPKDGSMASLMDRVSGCGWYSSLSGNASAAALCELGAKLNIREMNLLYEGYIGDFSPVALSPPGAMQAPSGK